MRAYLLSEEPSHFFLHFTISAQPLGRLCSTGSFVICCKRKISRMKQRKPRQRSESRESVWWTASLRTGFRNRLCSLRKRRAGRTLPSGVRRAFTEKEDKISSEYKAEGGGEPGSKDRSHRELASFHSKESLPTCWPIRAAVQRHLPPW